MKNFDWKKRLNTNDLSTLLLRRQRDRGFHFSLRDKNISGLKVPDAYNTVIHHADQIQGINRTQS